MDTSDLQDSRGREPYLSSLLSTITQEYLDVYLQFMNLRLLCHILSIAGYVIT